MAGRVENLRHFTSDQDREAARINGAKGGRKSAETKRRRKTMSEALDVILSNRYYDKSGNEIDGTVALMYKAFQNAMDGDMTAMKFIRDTIGEMPVQRVEQVQIDQSAYDEVMRALLGERQGGDE